MFFKHKSELILSSIVTLSVVSTSLTFYLLPHNFNKFFWTIFFCLFIVFYRLGNTKLKQIKFVFLYSLLTFLALSIVGISTLIPNPYYVFSFALLIFIPLCISRYIPGGRTIGVFMTVYVIVFYSFYPHLHIGALHFILTDILYGLILALSFTLLFIIILPLDKIHVLPLDKSSTVLKQSFRVAISISIASYVTQIYHLTNPLWVYISILIINQTHLGLSVKKAIERLCGTLIGAIIGSVVAAFLFETHPSALYFCVIIIFLTFYYIRRNYLLGRAFATILVTASFYLLKPNIGIHQFIFNRVIDTLVGLFIGILGEIFIFPQSLIQIIRQDVKKYYLTIKEIFIILENNTRLELIPSKIATLDTLRYQFAHNLKLIRNELITKVAKRYSYIHDVYSMTYKIEKLIKQLVKEDINTIDKIVFSNLVEAMNILYKIYPKLDLEEDDVAKVCKKLEYSYYSLSDNAPAEFKCNISATLEPPFHSGF